MCSSVFRAIKDEEDVLFIAVKKIGRLKLQLIIKKNKVPIQSFSLSHTLLFLRQVGHTFSCFTSAFFQTPRKKVTRKIVMLKLKKISREEKLSFSLIYDE